MSRLIAIDCDLRRIHAWDAEFGKLCYRAPDFTPLWQGLREHVTTDMIDATLLFEVASPVDYTDAGAAAIRYNKRRWMLWNMAKAMELDAEVAYRMDEYSHLYNLKLLVAPSHAWTMGYTEKQRGEIACVSASNHDLRECQAMIYFYRKKPQLWTSLSSYLQSL